MDVTPALVADQHAWVRDRAPIVVALANTVRDDLAAVFETDVGHVDEAGYRRVVDETFADGERAVNAAALVAILRDLDVDGDYPGFVVDELLGRELAAVIAGAQPRRLLAEATFHYADLHSHDGDAGGDDLDAALAAGVQTRLPGWEWTTQESSFGVRTE